MERVVKCSLCYRQFTTERPRKKYCSATCKEAATRAKRILWKKNNPHYDRDYMREYRKRKKEATDAD